jgi:DnaJ-class molecular chaperone
MRKSMRKTYNGFKGEWIELDEEKEFICPKCKGAGKEFPEYGLIKKCPTCEGEGKVDWLKNIIRCLTRSIHPSE